MISRLHRQISTSLLCSPLFRSQGCSPTLERSSSPIDMIGAGSPLSQGNSPLQSPSAYTGHHQPGSGGMGLMDGSGNYSVGLENYTGHTELSKEFSKFSMVGGGKQIKRLKYSS